MSELKLTVKSRAKAKASFLTGLRSNSQVPGVIYGLAGESQMISADYNSLVKVINEAGTSRIINLDVDGKNIPVILREVQKNPVSDRLSHVDFLAVSDKKLITTIVPLKFTGTSKAVREQGGKLEIKKQLVRVRCLPQDLPAVIEVNLSELVNIGSDIKVDHLPVDKKVKIIDGANDPVVDVVVPKKEVLSPVESAAVEGATPGAAGEASAGESAAEKKE